jgi:hypothetical protein
MHNLVVKFWKFFSSGLNPYLNSSHGYRIKKLLKVTMARLPRVQGTNHAHWLNNVTYLKSD